MATHKLFNGYWLGFQADGNPLGATPSYVNTVTLFVAAPAQDRKSLGTNYLCSGHPCDQQIAWVHQLQAQGTEVLMSLLDTPHAQWDEVDIPAFVRNVKEQVIDSPWGLNGVDIDLESGMPSGMWTASFRSLIQEFRSQLGPKGVTNSSGRVVSRLSVVAYRPRLEKALLEDVGQELDWLNTMAYWQDLSASQQMFKTYRQWVDQVNIGIGVSYQRGQSTSLNTVRAIARWAGQTENCGMMQYALNNDCPQFTNQPEWTWASAIRDGLGS
jgi:hypothetical protein